MDNIKIGIVVLNYINFSDTISCVNSILQQTYKNYIIVIVENGSPNESYSVLSELFQDNPKVEIIKNHRNLGFAKGNNIGIDYARNKFKIDYLFILNSDTILDNFLLGQIVSLKIDKDIGAFSPTVINYKGEIQFPTEQVNNIYWHTILKFLYLNYSLFGRPFSFIFKYFRRGGEKIEDIVPRDYRFRIHGSAFFLTPVFFQHYKKPYPLTFLYWEEVNLLWYLYMAGLRCEVFSTSGVLHKESKSADIVQRIESMNLWKIRKSYASFLKSVPLYVLPYFIIRRF